MQTSPSARRARKLIASVRERKGLVLALTGAGISAESGVPTFRGEDGYWRVGSRNYQPQELATARAFSEMPAEIWAWYLFRRSTCRAAQPNRAHLALASLQQTLGDGFLLITQNVDGLHLRAGSTRRRTYEIHGNIDFVRCSAGCPGLKELPSQIPLVWDKERRLTTEERNWLRCSKCDSWLRPHVLWFDESYDEQLFRYQSSLRAAASARLLLVVGTTGATNLPLQVAAIAADNDTALLVINPEPNPFSRLAVSTGHGVYLESTACGNTDGSVPSVVDRITEELAT